MKRRAQLPGASELFRLTGASPATVEVIGGGASGAPAAAPSPRSAGSSARSAVTPLPSASRPRPARRPSGRQRHDEKITVYLSSRELVELERVRLDLRADHGVAVDRGRVVREAVAIVLADFETHGDDSVLLRRLAGDA